MEEKKGREEGRKGSTGAGFSHQVANGVSVPFITPSLCILPPRKT